MALLIGIDSYITLQYANDNILNPDVSIIWNALADDQKESYIKYITRLFDNIGWIGNKKEHINQVMKFPRIWTDYYGYMKYDELFNEVRKYMEDSEGKIFDDIKIAIVRIIEDILLTQGNRSLELLQKSGVKEFEAGSLSFQFDKDINDPVWSVIEDSFLYFLTMEFWSIPDCEVARA